MTFSAAAVVAGITCGLQKKTKQDNETTELQGIASRVAQAAIGTGLEVKRSSSESSWVNIDSDDSCESFTKHNKRGLSLGESSTSTPNSSHVEDSKDSVELLKQIDQIDLDQSSSRDDIMTEDLCIREKLQDSFKKMCNLETLRTLFGQYVQGDKMLTESLESKMRSQIERCEQLEKQLPKDQDKRRTSIASDESIVRKSLVIQFRDGVSRIQGNELVKKVPDYAAPITQFDIEEELQDSTKKTNRSFLDCCLCFWRK